MDRLRKWISCVVMLAFVVTTMPSISHATMLANSVDSPSVSDQAGAAREDCAGHDGQMQGVQKAADQSGPQGEKKCCDKICKCVNSACNGTAKIIGQHSIGLTPSGVRSAAFAFEEQTLDSGIVSRLKRPPRA